MSKESTGRICLKSTNPLNIIHSQLKMYINSFEPPYNIQSILSQFSSDNGLPFQIVITHATKDISIAQTRVLPPIAATQVREVQTQQMHAIGHHQWSDVTPVSRCRSESSDLDCSICLETIFTHELCFVPMCEHVFHKNCLSRWASCADSCPTCPTCRTPLVPTR